MIEVTEHHNVEEDTLELPRQAKIRNFKKYIPLVYPSFTII